MIDDVERLREGAERAFVGRELDDVLEAELALERLRRLARLVRDEAVDRASAFEILRERAEGRASAPATGSWRRPEDVRTRPAEPESARRAEAPRRAEEAPRSEEPRGPAPRREKSAIEKVILGDGRRQGLAEAMAKSVARQVGSSLGRQIIRGVLGSILKR